VRRSDFLGKAFGTGESDASRAGACTDPAAWTLTGVTLCGVRVGKM
jgi:hypothetical protein